MANYVFIIISYDTSRAFALYTRFAVCLKWCFCSVSLTNNWIYSWDLWGRFIRTRTLLKCAIMEIWRWKGPCTSCFHVSSEAQTHARTRTHTHTDSYTHTCIYWTHAHAHTHTRKQTNRMCSRCNWHKSLPQSANHITARGHMMPQRLQMMSCRILSPVCLSAPLTPPGSVRPFPRSQNNSWFKW